MAAQHLTTLEGILGCVKSPEFTLQDLCDFPKR